MDAAESNGMVAPAPGAGLGLGQGQASPSGGKASIFSFIFHEHSFLGLFVPDNPVSPPIQPCCCLCIFTDALTRRHRLFIFVVVLALMIGSTVEVQTGIHSSLWGIMLQVFFIAPITCHLKSKLPAYSAWFHRKGVGPFGPAPHVRAEEILLVLGIVYAIVSMAQHTAECEACDDGVHPTQECSCTAALVHALSAWASALLFEAATLPIIYFCASALLSNSIQQLAPWDRFLYAHHCCRRPGSRFERIAASAGIFTSHFML